MGIYIFSYDKLKKYLTEDENNPESSNDFGKNIIPAMLENGEKLSAWKFEGYWKDVGTVSSLWEANMDLIGENPAFDIADRKWNIYSRNKAYAPHYIGENAKIKNSNITEGCSVDGTVLNSIISRNVEIGKDSVIKESVIMEGAVIGEGVKIEKAIIGEGVKIADFSEIGLTESENNPYESAMCTDGIVMIEGGVEFLEKTIIPKNSMVCCE